MSPIGLAKIEHAAHIAMGDIEGRGHCISNPVYRFLFSSDLRFDEFERDLLLGIYIFDAVDRPHSSFAKLLDDFESNALLFSSYFIQSLIYNFINSCYGRMSPSEMCKIHFIKGTFFIENLKIQALEFIVLNLPLILYLIHH